jgi:hypothetical protein
MTEPKIVSFDIETMPNLVWSWDVYASKGWNAIDTVKEWHPFSIGYKFLGKKTQYISLDQYKGWKPLVEHRKDGAVLIRQANVKPMLEDIWDVLNGCMAIGWNSKAFDIKMLNTWFLKSGMPIPKIDWHVDVMSEKKKLTRGSPRSLDGTGEEWGTGRKTKHQGWPLWYGCMLNDKKALRLMHKYCVQDVDLTERNYMFLRPNIKNHPPMNVLLGNYDKCATCGVGDVKLNGNDHKSFKTGKKTLYGYCMDCGAPNHKRVPLDSFNKVEFVR